MQDANSDKEKEIVEVAKLVGKCYAAWMLECWGRNMGGLAVDEAIEIEDGAETACDSIIGSGGWVSSLLLFC